MWPRPRRAPAEDGGAPPGERYGSCLRMTAMTIGDLLRVGLAAAAIGGCATPYQARGLRGGHSDVEVKPGLHYLVFEANAYLSPAATLRYWHFRAAELCGGSDRYRVLGRAELEREQVVPARAITHWRIAGVEGYLRCLRGAAVSRVHET
jgi:hypothetical protein